MKKLLQTSTLILILLVCLSACKNVQKGDNTKSREANTEKSNVNISFKLKGIWSAVPSIDIFGDAQGCDLLLSTSSKIATKRSRIPNEKEFTIVGNIKEPVVIRFYFPIDRQFVKSVDGNGYMPVKCAQMFMVLVPGANYTVSGDLTAKDFVDLYPAEDTENINLSKLTSQIMPLLNKGTNAYIKLARLGKKATKIQTKELNAISEECNKKVSDIKQAFLKENASSIAGLWLMEDMIIRSQIEFKDLETIFNTVDANKYGDNYFYKTIKSRIEGAKKSAVGSMCPPVFGKDIVSGEDIKLADFKGKYLLIDFWGTWCGACIAGMPEMKKFADAHKNKLVLLGLAKDNDIKLVKTSMKRNHITWKNMLIGDGDRDFVAKFNVQGFPTKILVDPEGKIVLRFTGEDPSFYKNMEKILSK